MSEQLDRLYERLLVLRCQAGDESAFAEIVQRYHARLRLFLRRMLDDEHVADDALQEVWLDVFRNVARLQDTGAFTGWLYRIARDRAYRTLRGRGVKLTAIDELDVPADAGDEVMDEDERRMVQSSLDHLPHEQREVLLLRFVEQMSYQQIASAVGCEIGTVRSRLHYAKRALRQRIERSREHE